MHSGVLLYELLDGRPPFQSTRHFELVQRIVTVDIRMPCVSGAAGMLVLASRRRPAVLCREWSIRGVVRLCSFQHIATDAADLIRKLLKYEPSERLALVGTDQPQQFEHTQA